MEINLLFHTLNENQTILDRKSRDGQFILKYFIIMLQVNL